MYCLHFFFLACQSQRGWKTFSKCLNNIKAALLWVTPAVVIEGWHYFTAWFYHSHQNLNREISGPSESDKSHRNCTVSLAAARIPAMILWLHWLIFFLTWNENSRNNDISLIVFLLDDALISHQFLGPFFKGAVWVIFLGCQTFPLLVLCKIWSWSHQLIILTYHKDSRQAEKTKPPLSKAPVHSVTIRIYQSVTKYNMLIRGFNGLEV